MLRALPMTLRETSATAARSRPSSAAAPAILLSRMVAATSAAPGGVEAVLDGDVVVHDDGLDLDVLGGGQLGGHLEVHDVAGVVEHDVQHARAAVHALRGREHLVGHRGGEHLAGTRGVEATRADESALQRLVPRPAAETMPTLPCTGASPRKTTLFSWSTRSCGCASSTPRNASVTTSAVSLISFFIGAPIGGGGLSVSYAAVTPTGTSDRERLGIGLAAVGRPAYITAGRVTDLGRGARCRHVP
jgi:hypothetical protein